MKQKCMSQAHGSVAVSQLVLALGGLALGTGEFSAMGLLPGVADSFQVSIPVAGHLISAYAIGVVIGAPLLAVLGARMDKRRLLMGLGLLILIGNGATALAASYGQIALARFISGLPHGAYYGTAGLVAASLVPDMQRTQAIGRVMLGLAAANLIGVPLATWLGQSFGWRSAFALVALGGAVLTLLLPLFVPKRPAAQDASPLRELSALITPQVWLTLATATIGFGGMFAVYSYITPTLMHVTGQAQTMVPWFLAFWGLGMVVGNTAGSWLADKSLTGAIFGFLVWNIVFLALFSFGAPVSAMAAGLLFLIGIGFALVPALQARLMDAAPQAQTLASAMNHSAFNMSNAIGAWTGGLAITYGFGWASTGLVGALLAGCGLMIFIVANLIRGGTTRSPKFKTEEL